MKVALALGEAGPYTFVRKLDLLEPISMYSAEIDHLVVKKFSMSTEHGFQRMARPPTVPVASVQIIFPCFQHREIT
jgi:hypothetical protein